MKEIIEKIKNEIGNLKGILILDLENEKIIDKDGKTEIFEEGLLIIGSTTETALTKNFEDKKLKEINIILKTEEKIVLFKKDRFLLGVIGEEFDQKKLSEIIKEIEIKEVPEKKTKEEYIPSPIEKMILNKLRQINELIKEFGEGDGEKWSKVAYAKIKDSSPELADCLEQKEREIELKIPIQKELNEEEINKAFRYAIDIIWKMAVSKFGVEEAKKRVKKVVERLKLI